MRKLNIFIASFLFCLFIFGCSDKKAKDEKWQDDITTGLIPIAVDESFEPIIQTELAVFESVYPSAGVIPEYTTETKAMDLLSNDSVRLAIISRKLTLAEKKSFEAKKRFPVEWKIATDAIALIVNKSNPDSILSVENFRKILTGEISTWKELNPRSPLNGTINVVFDNKESGTLRYVVDSVCKGAPLKANLYAEKKNKEVINYVANSPHALGIIGVNWVGYKGDDSTKIGLRFNDQVRVVAVSKLEFADEQNSYKPYQAYIANGSYPLNRGVYAILNDPKGGLSTGLTSFLCSQRGQFIILKSGLVPETQSVRLIQVKKDF